jgi:hypothetical protein
LFQALEDVRVKDFVAVRAIEALDEGALLRCAGLNEGHLDPVCLAPVDEGLGLQFGAVVDANRRVQTTELAQLFP